MLRPWEEEALPLVRIGTPAALRGFLCLRVKSRVHAAACASVCARELGTDSKPKCQLVDAQLCQLWENRSNSSAALMSILLQL